MTADPLKQGPRAEQACFESIQRAAAGFPFEAVLGAAVNLIVNAVRQGVSKRKEAEVLYDAFMHKGKSILIDKHYDPVTGNRRTIFPFTQVLQMPFHVEDDKVKPG